MYNLTCYLHIDLILVMKMCSLLSRFAGSRNNKGITVGVVVAGVFLALVIIALFAFIKRQKSPNIISVPRGKQLKKSLPLLSYNSIQFLRKV